MDLATEITFVKGVGPRRAGHLKAKGIETLEDLLYYPPFRYEDRTNVKPISRLAPGEMATVIAEVSSTKASGFRRRDLGLFEARFADGSGETLVCKWFHAGYLANVFAPGLKVALYGKIELDTYSAWPTILHPEFEILSTDDEDQEDVSLHTGRVVPIYEAAGKVTTKQLRRIVHGALEQLPEMPDPIPAAILARYKLPDRASAIRRLHFPAPDDDLRLLNSFRSPAQFRMIFEEFFWLECGLALKRATAKKRQGISFALNDKVREKIKTMLPFKPTGAQKRALGEIARDMASPVPMNRLLQGDVGSGKTLVAAEAAIIAIENGYQVAVLAPTEILAAQHFLYFRRLFDTVGYHVSLLIGAMPAREKSEVKALISSGMTPVVVGTHALLEEDVQFQHLGLAIVDEQHRFGVLQRLTLLEKGAEPDVLVMTATPIPRTLALTIYGDLDTSVIDELPPGRKPVVTRHSSAFESERVFSFVKEHVDKGRQAYIVYPLVEESETQSVKAAQQEYERLSTVVFPTLRLGLLHGRLPADEKDAVMSRFKNGKIQILVSTTVIEVGVDVPNATVMVIEHAERFGLAQLHQLRGRVGRGGEQSYCVLVTDKMNEAAGERIRTLLESSDGFHIAEMDLKLRGPGEFFGTRQSGLPNFRIGSILRDRELLELARREAIAFTGKPPSQRDLDMAVDYLRTNWQRRYGLVLVA